MSDEKEGDPGYEGSPGEEGEIVGSNLSTKRQKTMLELLELHDKRVKSPDLDPSLEKSIHKLDDFAPSPTRYARRQRLQLVIKRAGKPEVKKALSGDKLCNYRSLHRPEERHRPQHAQIRHRPDHYTGRYAI
jgi:hypothetical protein